MVMLLLTTSTARSTPLSLQERLRRKEVVMGVSNGIVTAPVNPQEVYNLLGVGKYNGWWDIGYICSVAEHINPFSVKKPYSDRYRLSDETENLIKNMKPVVLTGSNAVEGYKWYSVLPTVYVDFSHLLDFDGYDHNTLPFVYNDSWKSGSKTLANGATLDTDSISDVWVTYIHFANKDFMNRIVNWFCTGKYTSYECNYVMLLVGYKNGQYVQLAKQITLDYTTTPVTVRELALGYDIDNDSDVYDLFKLYAGYTWNLMLGATDKDTYYNKWKRVDSAGKVVCLPMFRNYGMVVSGLNIKSPSERRYVRFTVSVISDYDYEFPQNAWWGYDFNNTGFNEGGYPPNSMWTWNFVARSDGQVDIVLTFGQVEFTGSGGIKHVSDVTIRYRSGYNMLLVSDEKDQSERRILTFRTKQDITFSVLDIMVGWYNPYAIINE